MAFFSKKPKDVPRRRRDAPGATKREAESTVPSNTTFRRNRTLTGSISSKVTSAGEPRADLQSPRTQAHHLTRQRRKVSSIFVGVIGACLLCAGLIYELTAHPVVMAVDGGIPLKNERYVAAIDEYLTRHPVERLRFVLNHDRLNEYIQRTLPEVSSIRPEGFAGIGASQFSIAVRKPIASWLIGQTQYYVDSAGVPFETNYYETPGVRIVDESGIKQAEGTAIASSRFLTFVGKAVAAAGQYKMSIEQAVIPPDTTRQIQLRATGHKYPVKLSLDRPVGEQIEDMQRVLAHLDSKKITPQYVDVRVSGRAYYK